MRPEDIHISAYNYVLPSEKIAAFPLAKRDQSKLLVYQKGEIKDAHFERLSYFLPQSATIVLNNTRVIKARLLFKKQTGAIIEIFCLEPMSEPVELSLLKNRKVEWVCLIGGASKWKPGQVLKNMVNIGDTQVELSARYIKRHEDGFIIEFSWQPEQVLFSEVLNHAGAIPLPPYIKRPAEEQDKDRYQTVFGIQEGSVAAPTAALHFTPEVFKSLAEKNVATEFITLHVGAGTFKPVKTESVANHQMHSEPFTVSKTTIQKLMESETIIAVGTTSLRTIESLHWLAVKLIKGMIKSEWKLDQWEAYHLSETSCDIHYKQSLEHLVTWMGVHDMDELHCQTSLIIVPGYNFQIPSALITNFHQPQSTLLLLISAFIGEDWRKVYQHALENDYRFLSYGDSSLLWRN